MQTLMTLSVLLLGDFSVIRPEPGLLFWSTVIFLLFWFLMSRFAFKPITEALKKRETDIQDALDQAKKAREDMANLQAEHTKLLVQAREERSVILKEAKEAKEQILSEAKERANQEYKNKLDSAIADINNQKMAAMVDLKNQVGKMGLEIASKILKKELAGNPEQVAYSKTLADDMKLN